MLPGRSENQCVVAIMLYLVAVSTSISSRPSSLEARRESDGLVVTLAGDWNIRSGIASVADVKTQLKGAPTPGRITYDTRELGAWVSALLTTLIRIAHAAAAQDILELIRSTRACAGRPGPP